MSIKIIIKNDSSKAIIISDNMPNVMDYINTLEPHTFKGSELRISIIDVRTGNFHIYDFEYLRQSKLSPRKWLLNNILYSITCDDTEENFSKSFDNICKLMLVEYNKL